MRRARDLLLLVVLLGVGTAAGGGGTFAKWTSAAENTGNSLATGTIDVNLSSSTALFSLASASPGAQPSKCVVVRNDGTVKTKVALYGEVTGDLAPYLKLKVTRGQKGATCAAPGTGTVIFGDAALSGFPTSSATALEGVTEWAAGDSYPYTFELTLLSDSAAQGKKAGIAMTWEGRP